MNIVLTPDQAIEKRKQLQKQKIVLAGGCFDILHIGHITFLQKAKEQGDVLFVFLESDETITKLKGPQRPIHTQQERATILATLRPVDYVITLHPNMTNDDYDQLVKKLQPDIIAATAHDTGKIHKERQAKLSGAKLVEVTNPVPNKSTSLLLKVLAEE